MGLNGKLAVKKFFLESYPDVLGFKSVKVYALGYLIFIVLMCIWGYTYYEQDDTNEFVSDFKKLALSLMVIVGLLIFPTILRSRWFTRKPFLWPVWKPQKVALRYWWLAFTVPLLYNLPSFFLTWIIVTCNDGEAVSFSTSESFIIDVEWDSKVLIDLLLFLVLTLFQEYCFSGFLGPELLNRFSIRHATVLTGIANDLWYKPFFVAGLYISSDVDWVDLASCFNVIVLRIILMILMIKSGSMFVPWAMHFWYYVVNCLLCAITVYSDNWVIVLNGVGLGGYGSLFCGVVLWSLLYRYELNANDPEIAVVSSGVNSTRGVMMRVSDYVPKDEGAPIVKV